MLVVYGVERSRIALENIYHRCRLCGSSDHVQLMVSQKYFYLYGVPCFPLGKEGTIQCLKCKFKIDDRSFSAEEKSQYDLIKKECSDTAMDICRNSSDCYLSHLSCCFYCK